MRTSDPAPSDRAWIWPGARTGHGAARVISPPPDAEHRGPSPDLEGRIVKPNYFTGLLAVVSMLVVSTMVCGFGADRSPARTPMAAEDLGDSARPVGPFRLEESSGRTVTADDLSDRVAIASFIFTRCALSCPRITGIMKDLQGRLAGSDVLLVSFSVDPEHDTPSVLKTYAERYGAATDRWWFLTGPRDAIYDMIRDRFQLGVMPATAPAGPDNEAVIHSDRLALIDHGRVVGLFDSNDPKTLDALVFKARRRALPAWVTALPSINAGLNGLSACLLIAGWVLIRRYRYSAPTPAHDDSATVAVHPMIRGHIACMVSAIATSALFLTCYLIYHSRAGSMPFAQGGPLRVAYLAILMSHTLLAIAAVPLILTTVRRAWTGRFDRHVSIATITLPIWLYVAVTGVVIYLMLYHLPAMPLSNSPGM